MSFLPLLSLIKLIQEAEWRNYNLGVFITTNNLGVIKR